MHNVSKNCMKLYLQLRRLWRPRGLAHAGKERPRSLLTGVLLEHGALAIIFPVHLKTERHWAPWRVVLTHLSWWRELLRDTAAGPHLQRFLAGLHPTVQVYSAKDIASGKLNEDELWLSGALLSAGVEWENPKVTKQALALYDAWSKRNQTIPELYQEAAFTAGVRTYGEEAWSSCWGALVRSHAAPRPLHSHRALLAALAAPADDWLFYRCTPSDPKSTRTDGISSAYNCPLRKFGQIISVIKPILPFTRPFDTSMFDLNITLAPTNILVHLEDLLSYLTRVIDTSMYSGVKIISGEGT
ncbi:hypothetical protein EVAR_48988_1 [Eumeta japonica]|uniref:ERAP1-like C-terminal domain-containing protein n=1 Tax=Eumeta variegata TaxID=151549 RepID=A0A4C1Z2S3_EUMVA|nr:hypothetical protein EVAR_48988_1 [Eumeta japonica]